MTDSRKTIEVRQQQQASRQRVEMQTAGSQKTDFRQRGRQHTNRQTASKQAAERQPLDNRDSRQAAARSHIDRSQTLGSLKKASRRTDIRHTTGRQNIDSRQQIDINQ